MYYLNSRYYNSDLCRFINADGLVQTPTGSLISHNMYSYCENNPINMIDQSGMWAFVIPAISGISTVIAATVGFVTGLLAGGAIVDYTRSETQAQTQTKAKSEPITKTPTKQKHTVYTLKNTKTNTVEYVGRTSRPPTIRKAEHKLNPARSNLRFDVYATGLDKYQARGLEQRLIQEYQTLNKNNPTNNQRNGISWDNPNRNKYMEAASIFLNENETYVGP